MTHAAAQLTAALDEVHRALRATPRADLPLTLDPEDLIAQEAAADAARAARRGQRLRAAAELVALKLHAQGQLRCSVADLTQELVVELAAALFPGRTVDI